MDTHTHADHFSATRELARHLGVPTVMHHATAAVHVDLRVEDGEQLLLGSLRLRVLHTPGHTPDSMCLLADDGRVFTGDTLQRPSKTRCGMRSWNWFFLPRREGTVALRRRRGGPGRIPLAQDGCNLVRVPSLACWLRRVVTPYGIPSIPLSCAAFLEHPGTDIR